MTSVSTFKYTIYLLSTSRDLQGLEKEKERERERLCLRLVEEDEDELF